MKIKETATQLVLTVFLHAAIFTHANAAGNSSGAVTSITPIASGQVFVTTASATSQPACSRYGWVIDLNGSATVAGRAMLATIMWAQAMGKQISVIGTGTCDVWSDRETIAGVTAI